MALLLQILTLAAFAQGDPAKDLRSKDHVVRLAAVEALASQTEDPKLNKLLVGALKDDDWEVVEAAIVALGNGGGKSVDKRLLDLAIDTPLARHRRAAARSLAKRDAAANYLLLEKKLSGKTMLRALEAMQSFGVLHGSVEIDDLEKIVRKSEDKPEQLRLAQAALVLLASDRSTRLAELWPTASAWSRAEMMDVLRGEANASLAPLLISFLDEAKLSDVVERRIRWVVRELGTEAATALLAELGRGGESLVQARRIRLLVDLVDAEAIEVNQALQALLAALDSSEGLAQSAGTLALSQLGQEASEPLQAQAIEWLTQAATQAGHRQIRGNAVRGLAGFDAAENDEIARTLAQVLAKDESPRAREDAAVALAVKGQPIAVQALRQALNDSSWTVAVTAAVSLGMTRDEDAIADLIALSAHSDWKMRGAAVIALQRSYLKSGVPPIIEALEDEDATVRRTAHETLARISKQNFPAEKDPWLSWWSQVERAIQLYDPDEVKVRQKKYGYGGVEDRDTGTLFDGFDVVVFQSRGDHIENVLGKLEIEHRLTAGSKVDEAELHPHAACVVNCTGEITRDDAERIAWFVRTGGYLLGSCWTLSMTINTVYPGVLAKLETRGEVMDDVLAVPCAPDSPYLLGVFPDGCEPRYALEGAHLIEVLDYERTEVLVDSPECAETWGEGNLAAWFPAGHGLILDSVNHFEEQGFMRATHLKKIEERQAYAIDHLGLRYEQLREIVGEKFWNKNSQAAQEVLDLSVFRIVSNFVREKRISADG